MFMKVLATVACNYFGQFLPLCTATQLVIEIIQVNCVLKTFCTDAEDVVKPDEVYIAMYVRVASCDVNIPRLTKSSRKLRAKVLQASCICYLS
jgi:hypothetical protein